MDIRASYERLVRHRLLIAAILIAGLSAVGALILHTKPAYVASATVLMVAEPAEQQSAAVPSSPTKPVVSTDLPTLVQSNIVLNRVARDLGIAGGSQSVGPFVKAKLQGANIMTVQYTAASPAEAIRGANVVGGELTRYYRDIATTRFDSLSADLRGLLAQTRAKLQADDEQLASAARFYPYVDTKAGAGEGQSIYARLVALQTARDEASAAAAGSAALANVASRLTADMKPLARAQLGESDPRYRMLRDQYARDLTEYEKARARFAATYPGLPELTSIVARERAAVASARAVVERTPLASSPAYAQALAETTKDRAAAANEQARVAALSREIASLEHMLSDKSGTSARISRLRRDRDAASETYSLLSAKLAMTLADRAVAASTGSVIVADPAAFARRSIWSSTMVLAVALGFVVIWVAFAVPFVVEALDRRFRVKENVEALYGAPIIASVR